MQLLSNDIIRAIGWTLIHSLWQGLVLALVAGILILFTRKSRPALRYNIFTLLFFLLTGSALLTFFYELRQPTGHAVMTGGSTVEINAAATTLPDATPVLVASAATPQPDFSRRFAAYFNEHAPLLVMLWFIVFVARMLWLFGGLVYVQRIRHYKTSVPDTAFMEQLSVLCRRIRLNSKVQLLESALVKVPAALGILKPVILMPLGMLAQLPPDQVEAVLLHELAHIRRRDFLVNLVQHFAETIFFFNPALLWLSARIREEREHCCDDIAINVTQSRSNYIQALVSFQEFQLAPQMKYAMAFPGRKKQLLHRVKRILGSNNKTLNIAEKSFLLVCFSLIGMLGIVFSQPEKQQAIEKQVTAQVQEMEDKSPVPEIVSEDKPAREVPPANVAGKDEAIAPPAEHDPANAPSVNATQLLNAAYYYYDVDIKGITEGTAITFDGEPFRVYLFKRNNTVYQVQWDERHNELAALKVDGDEVFTRGMDRRRLAPYIAALQAMTDIYRMPYRANYQANYQPYQPWQTKPDSVPVLRRGNSIMSGTMTTTMNGKKYAVTLDSNRVTGLTIDGEKVPDEELPSKYPLINSIINREERLPVITANKHQQLGRMTSEKSSEASQERLSQTDAVDNGRLTPATPAAPAAPSTPPPYPRVQTAPHVQAVPHVQTSPQIQVIPHPAPPSSPVMNKEADKILDDMRKDGLIKNKDKFSFQLNQTALIVDGEKQPDDVFRKYKDKYIKKPSDAYMYSKSYERTSISINN
ncbi:M56 family metallopeptidase [uncultured Chitinophaga sp.]|jgi:Antirepressor regulating drug resistance, predicted signal transduction N-terminal membrane component|uniref:M56 family metallopeptidase n=1 Tax=uncultured Chitinophaga sp. TaxID=339340 RepID=UPI00262E9D74|nr:M56 family metallopeptidase [uncultured Chitinophaga sp.]